MSVMHGMMPQALRTETASPPCDAEHGDSSAPCELTLLLPCRDEAETLAACIRAARSFLHAGGKGKEISGEILVINDGSTDASAAVAQACGARVISTPPRGYGAALRLGMAEAHGRFIIMGDADGTYDFTALLPLWQALRDGADVVIGNRFAGGIARGSMPLPNRMGGAGLSWLGRLLCGAAVRDFHCGLRGGRTAALQALPLRTDGMEFASEMVVEATRAGLCIREVPVCLRPRAGSRAPHLRPFRDGWRHLCLLCRAALQRCNKH